MMTSVCDNDDTKDKDHLVVGTQMHETIAFFHEQKRSGLN